MSEKRHHGIEGRLMCVQLSKWSTTMLLALGKDSVYLYIYTCLQTLQMLFMVDYPLIATRIHIQVPMLFGDLEFLKTSGFRETEA